MAVPYLTQLQPWEENQSPSPTDEIANPYEVSLIRSRSSGRPRSPPSPVIQFPSLQRQLSGDTDNPPPPWARRPSINSSSKSVRSPSTVSRKSGLDSISAVSSASAPPVPSVPPGQLAPPSRRHPGLTMTSAASDSPSGSSTSLNNDDLGLPNPAFRRRPGSNRSSMTQSSLTSEELWALEQQANGPPDLSNPMRQAAERPLDTIKRMSRQVERQYSGALPGDVIWPSAPPIEEVYVPPIKSRSSTNIVSLNKRGGRRRTSRQTSLDMTRPPLPDGAKSMPTSPNDYVTSSARSSSTSLASQTLKPHPMMMNRPPVSYYQRDFMTSLAPREGGYAIAAQLASAVSSPGDDSRYPISRASSRHAPAAPSTGMGRWSLDGGENFAKPYGTPSAATTSSSFSGGQTQSPEDSPPAEMHSSPPLLPNGASPPQLDTSGNVTTPANSVPVHPSPLKVSTANLDASTAAATESNEPTPVASKSSGMLSALGLRKSTRTLAKSSKDADKAEAAKVAQQRAASATEAAAKKAERETAEREAKVKADAEAAAALAVKEEARKKEFDQQEAARKAEAVAKEEARRKELAAAEIKRKEQLAAEEARKKEVAAQEEAKRKEQFALAEAKRKEQLAQAEVKRKEQAERDAARQKEAAEKAAVKRKEAAEKEAAKKKEKELRKAQGKGSFFGLRAPSSTANGQAKLPPRSTSQPQPPPLPVSTGPAPPRPSGGSQPFPKLADQSLPPPDLAPTPPRQTHTSLPLNALSKSPAPPPKPTTPATPQRTPSQRAAPPSARQRTSMFGTLKKRFSLLSGSEPRSVSPGSRASPRNSPSPSTPRATPSRPPPPIPLEPTRSKVSIPAGPTTPAKELPPVPASPVAVTVIAAESETHSKPLVSEFGTPLRDLPPRTTSHTSPRPDVARFPGLSPEFPSSGPPPSFQRSSSQGAVPITNSSPLTKTLSHNSGARSFSSQSDSIPRRSSVKGPRPMPHSSPEAKHASLTSHSDPIPSFPKLVYPVHNLPDGASPPHASSFPLAPQVDATNSRGSHGSSSMQADLVTPSTPGESDLSNSHSQSTGMDLVSPSWADDDRVVILDNGSNELPVEVVRDGKVPEGEGGDETIQADMRTTTPRVISVQ